MNIRLTGIFTLRSPLSHIGESISTTSYLVQEPLIQPDGGIDEVFCYSGNAWRGQLRDLSAAYMLEKLGDARVPLDTFHLLFSGGRIGGSQVVDIPAAMRLRQAVPHISIFGGGIGNQILAGKLRVGNSYPICREATVALPARFRSEHSYRGMTFEKSFSRRDDSKDGSHTRHLPPPERALLDGPTTRADGPADQMRMTVELLAAGARLYTEIEALDVSEVELGCLTAALHAFSRSPHIGGQANKGHGRVAVEYEFIDLDAGEIQPFLSITDGPALLSPPAEAAKSAYDQHLREQYDALLNSQGGEIRALLGAA